MTHPFDVMSDGTSLFDFLTITAETTPTRAEVEGMLASGALERATCSYGGQRLAQQWNWLAPRVWLSLESFEEWELDIGIHDLIVGHRLVELIGTRKVSNALPALEVLRLTAIQGELLSKLRVYRDRMVRLARQRKLDANRYRVNLGEGDASRAIPGAFQMLAFLDEDGAKFKLPKVVARLKADVKGTAEALRNSEIAQETGKATALPSTDTVKAARESLYALCLKISRLGPLAFPDDVNADSVFTLRILHNGSGPSTTVADDDDAPVNEAVEGAAVDGEAASVEPAVPGDSSIEPAELVSGA